MYKSVIYTPILILFMMFASGCGSKTTYDDQLQRSVVTAYAKAHFRGEEEVAYHHISKQDREVLEEDLKIGNIQSVLPKLKPWDLLKVVEVTNPYDIKSIELEQTFKQAPPQNTKTGVTVTRYNDIEQHYKLIWEGNEWKLDLGLASTR